MIEFGEFLKKHKNTEFSNEVNEYSKDAQQQTAFIQGVNFEFESFKKSLGEWAWKNHLEQRLVFGKPLPKNFAEVLGDSFFFRIAIDCLILTEIEKRLKALEGKKR